MHPRRTNKFLWIPAWLKGRRRVRSRMSCKGIAALEFGLFVPIFITTAAGLFDFTNAFLAWKRVNLTAESIAEISTIQAATQENLNILTQADADTSSSAVYAYLPLINSATPPAFGVVLTSVVMTPTVKGCETSCSYNANVAWSGVFQGSGTKRLCGPLSFVADTQGTNPATLPTGVAGPEPLIVVDVQYTFTPVFFKFITGPVVMKQSAYFPPRVGVPMTSPAYPIPSNWFQYFPGGADSTTLCPSYPAATSSS